MRRCLNCLTGVVEEAVFCPSCGARLAAPGARSVFRCWIHAHRFAPHQCSMCGRLMCRECRQRHMGRDICKVCYISSLVPKIFVNRFYHVIEYSRESSAPESKIELRRRHESQQDLLAGSISRG